MHASGLSTPAIRQVRQSNKESWAVFDALRDTVGSGSVALLKTVLIKSGLSIIGRFHGFGANALRKCDHRIIDHIAVDFGECNITCGLLQFLDRGRIRWRKAISSFDRGNLAEMDQSVSLKPSSTPKAASCRIRSIPPVSAVTSSTGP